MFEVGGSRDTDEALTRIAAARARIEASLIPLVSFPGE
jgi:hypothetical protein